MGENGALPDKPTTEDPAERKEPEQGQAESEAGSAEVSNAFRKLVKNKPEFLAEFTAMGMTTVGNPLYEKMTAEHISRIIDLSSKHDENQYDLHKRSLGNEHQESLIDRALGLIIFLVVVGVVVFVVLVFREKPDVLIPTLTGIGGFLGGFMGGWGFGSRRKG